MEGLNSKKYLHTTKKRFDPIALVLSLLGLAGVVYGVVYSDGTQSYYDLHSLLIVICGTFASILFQFDFGSSFYSLLLVLRSFLGTPEKKLLNTIKELDEAIIQQLDLKQMREGLQIDGEILNDIVFMYKRGLLFEEIDEFVTARISDEYLGRRVAVDLLKRASVIAPSLGLFGTTMGLIGVLRNLANPAEIGSSMSLALMTTAYGAALNSLFFTPLAGRLEHHNMIYLEIHQQLLNKVGILLGRDERKIGAAEKSGGIAA